MSLKKGGSNNRGLGRGLNDLGLDELLSDFGGEHVANEPMDQNSTTLRHIPVDYLQPGEYQPRKDMNQEALQELSSSIAEQGVIQPILVRPVGHDQFEILAGERRWRAAQLAGLDEVPVVVKQVGNETAMVMSLIENIQRENLNAMEEAQALGRLLSEFGLTHEQIAQAIGRSRAAVTNLLRLLSLDQEVKTMVEHGDLDMGHARALLPLEPEQQVKAANEMVAKGLSVREAETLVKRMQQGDIQSPKFTPQPDPDLIRLEEHLSQKMRAKVSVTHNAKGRGKIVLHYQDLDELDRLLQKIDGQMT